MKTVNHKLVGIALDKVTGTTFEDFFQAFYSALVGSEFVPLGGFHDGGADAFQGMGLFQHKTQRPDTFYQATIQEDHRAKIRHTVNRLKQVDREPKNLQYVTSRVIGMIDKEEEDLSNKLDIAIKIRDRKWIVNNINQKQQTIAAYHTYLEPLLSFLTGLGSATTIETSPNVPARTLCVFLGQEIRLRRGNTDLLEAVTDSLILWALDETDPDAGKLMTRADIRIKIETVLPSAKQFIREAFDHRIETMAKKENSTGREVRWYKQTDEFCLPFETRKVVTEENIEDQSLKVQILELYKYRAERILNTDEGLLPHEIVDLAHRVLELTFEQQGLEFSEFLTGEQEKNRDFTVADQVDSAIEEFGLSGTNAVKAKEVVLTMLRQGFYNSTKEERLYYDKLSRTYTLMFTLRNEPRIVEYFKDMSSNFVLLVGSDIIVRALSEKYLSPEDQMTVNMLRILREAGSTLMLTHMAIEEVHAHIKGTDNQFRNFFQELEPYIDKNIVRHEDKILIRAYFNAKFDTSLSVRPANWESFIEQICSYQDLHKNTVACDQVKDYLMEKFGFEYLDKIDVDELVDDDEVQELSDQISEVKSKPVLARNDARHILAVYGKRRKLRESHRPNPYGYRTWWLTHESKVLRCTRELVKSHGSKYIIRPDFILNFVALSPTTEAVRKSYGAVFPTLLGIKLSNRMREQVFLDVMGKVKEMRKVDEARAKAMMSQMSNDLKGDNYKQYETEWMAAQRR